VAADRAGPCRRRCCRSEAQLTGSWPRAEWGSRGDPGALQRLRAYVPRYAAATDASTAELRDARLIIAREVGFPTWWELVASAEKSRRDEAERQENWRRLRPEAEALLAGDTARLAQLTAGQADTLLQMLARREILGTKPGQGLGAPRATVDVLIGKATRPDLPLDQAVRSGRVEYVRLLLDAGADPGARGRDAACAAARDPRARIRAV
jgi:hypothetical protein